MRIRILIGLLRVHVAGYLIKFSLCKTWATNVFSFSERKVVQIRNESVYVSVRINRHAKGNNPSHLSFLKRNSKRDLNIKGL